MDTDYLNQLVQCLVDKDKLASLLRSPTENIAILHENTQELVDNYELHFNRCRKYNQAKIHRKYEIAIADLNQENEHLRAKLDLELAARPSSQKYVSDLIDKMVQLEEQNLTLIKENTSLSSLQQKYQEKHENGGKYRTVQKQQNPENKESQANKWEQGKAIEDAVAQLLERKEKQGQQLSPFQRLLELNSKKFGKWQVGDLLESIDKWAQHFKDDRCVNKARIKHRLEALGHYTEEGKPSLISRKTTNYSTLAPVTAPRSGRDSLLNKTGRDSLPNKTGSMPREPSFRLRSLSKVNCPPLPDNPMIDL